MSLARQLLDQRRREWIADEQRRIAVVEHPTIKDLMGVFPVERLELLDPNDATIETIEPGTLTPPVTDEPAQEQPEVGFDLDVEPEPTPAPVIEFPRASAAPAGVELDDFVAHMPSHSYIFMPARDMWPAASVNARIKPVPMEDAAGKPVLDEKGEPKTMAASTWLDRHRPVEQMTWSPSMGMLIRDLLVSDGGWIERPGCTTFNLYRPPTLTYGDAAAAGPWIEHVRRIYPDDAAHIIAWLAHRVQRPAEKINHALVLGGLQGIGKDTLLEPVKHAIGPWNFAEVSPIQLLGRFNAFAKSVILRISEARDMGDVDRYGFYEHTKAYMAAPPDVLRCDEKNTKEYAVWNVCGVIVTTNHVDSLYLPADDRRHYVAWSTAKKEDFKHEYWEGLYRWYADGGHGHVAAYLAALDLTAFAPKAPPAKTPAFWRIVDAGRAPEDAELADALDGLEWPEAVTLDDLAGPVPTEFSAWLKDRKNARQVPHRMETAGYVPVRNPTAKDGVWKVAGRRAIVYARRELTVRDQIAAVRRLVDGSHGAGS